MEEHVIQGRYQEALELWNEIRGKKPSTDRRIPPHNSPITLNVILKACKLGGFLEDAIKIWKVVKDDGAIPIDSNSLSCYIDVLCENGKYKEAVLEYRKAMRFSRVPVPDEKTRNHLISILEAKKKRGLLKRVIYSIIF